MTDDASPTAKSALSGVIYALLALGAAAIVVLVVVLLFRTDDPRVEQLGDEAGGANSIRQTSLNDRWIAPTADADSTDLLPQAFGGWDLQSSDENARNPAFGLTAEGRHGQYVRAGAASSADLYLYRSDDVAPDVLEQVRERLSDTARFGAVEFAEPPLTPGARTLQFNMAPAGGEAEEDDSGVPEAHGLLASVGGWLLFAQSGKERDLRPFLAAYMRAVEADGAAEPPPEPAPGDRTEPIAPGGGRPGQ